MKKAILHILFNLVVWAGGSLWIYHPIVKTNMTEAIGFWLFMSFIMSLPTFGECLFNGIKRGAE